PGPPDRETVPQRGHRATTQGGAALFGGAVLTRARHAGGRATHHDSTRSPCLETITMALEVTVGPPGLTINNRDTFLVSALDGCLTHGSAPGLYSRDTRYLSGHQLYINGERWTLLNARAIAYYASQVRLVNPMVATEEGGIALGTLSLRLSRALSEALHEDL